MSQISTKLQIDGDDSNTLASLRRLCDLYNGGVYAKTNLLKMCLAGGLIMKEAGLLDHLLNIDDDINKTNSSNHEKYKMLRKELIEILGGTIPQMAIAPIEASEPKKEPEIQTEPLNVTMSVPAAGEAPSIIGRLAEDMNKRKAATSQSVVTEKPKVETTQASPAQPLVMNPPAAAEPVTPAAQSEELSSTDNQLDAAALGIGSLG